MVLVFQANAQHMMFSVLVSNRNWLSLDKRMYEDEQGLKKFLSRAYIQQRLALFAKFESALCLGS